MLEPEKKAAVTECLRCGRCCQDPFSRYVSEEDVLRWKREKRFDILSVVSEEERALERATGMSALKMFKPCRFNNPAGEVGRVACAIHRTRPLICRRFEPGRSRLCPAGKPSGNS